MIIGEGGVYWVRNVVVPKKEDIETEIYLSYIANKQKNGATVYAAYPIIYHRKSKYWNMHYLIKRII